MKFHELTEIQKINWAKHEIFKRFEASGCEPITLTMKANGDVLRLEAFRDDMGEPLAKKTDEIELILVSGGSPYINGYYEDVEYLAERLIHYEGITQHEPRNED